MSTPTDSGSSKIDDLLHSIRCEETFAGANEHDLKQARIDLTSKEFDELINRVRDMYANIGWYEDYVECSKEFGLQLDKKHLETLLRKQNMLGWGVSFQILDDLDRLPTPVELGLIAANTTNDDERTKALGMMPDDMRHLVLTCVMAGAQMMSESVLSEWEVHFGTYLPKDEE